MFSSSRLRQKETINGEKILPGGESNLGLPRDRRGYSHSTHHYTTEDLIANRKYYKNKSRVLN